MQLSILTYLVYCIAVTAAQQVVIRTTCSDVSSLSTTDQQALDSVMQDLHADIGLMLEDNAIDGAHVRGLLSSKLSCRLCAGWRLGSCWVSCLFCWFLQ
jgi:hypothetical protein